jgi:hypothetical protein
LDPWPWVLVVEDFTVGVIDAITVDVLAGHIESVLIW